MLYENCQELKLPVLFDGAYNCTLEGKAGGGLVIHVNADGTLDVSCLSVLPMYLPRVLRVLRERHWWMENVRLGLQVKERS